jgi:DNA-binding MarR family transcriptional regulator
VLISIVYAINPYLLVENATLWPQSLAILMGMTAESKQQVVEQEVGFYSKDKPGSYLQLETFLPSVIRNLAEGISANMSRNYTGDLHLTVTEWRIILYLAARAPLTATEIVDMTSMEKSRVSRAVSQLEERNFVTRAPSQDDHRTKTLSLSDNGQKLYESIVPRVLGWERSLLKGLDIGEYRDLLYLLNKLQGRLDDM